MENKNRRREVNDSVKCNYISIIGLSEEEGREKAGDGLFEPFIAENFPNMGKKTGIEIQEAQITPIKFNKS